LFALIIVILAHVLNLAADRRTDCSADGRTFHGTATATADRPDTRRNYRAGRTAAEASNQTAEDTTDSATDSGAFCSKAGRINP
jgi:hypothetical protein